jgi:hypothetical protein
MYDRSLEVFEQHRPPSMRGIWPYLCSEKEDELTPVLDPRVAKAEKEVAILAGGVGSVV